MKSFHSQCGWVEFLLPSDWIVTPHCNNALLQSGSDEHEYTDNSAPATVVATAQFSISRVYSISLVLFSSVFLGGAAVQKVCVMWEISYDWNVDGIRADVQNKEDFEDG